MARHLLPSINTVEVISVRHLVWYLISLVLLKDWLSFNLILDTAGVFAQQEEELGSAVGEYEAFGKQKMVVTTPDSAEEADTTTSG